VINLLKANNARKCIEIFRGNKLMKIEKDKKKLQSTLKEKRRKRKEKQK